MTKQLIGAYTKVDAFYPGYVNVSQDGDVVTLIVRGDPTVRSDAGYICGHRADKGKAGRCTPGDDRCNNYCNSAPEKGPMQDHPKRCDQWFEGVTVSVTFTTDEWAKIIGEIGG